MDIVMITSAIDAHEGHVVKKMDFYGSFLHADLDEEVVMLLRGQLADLMVQVDPGLYILYSVCLKNGERREYSLHENAQSNVGIAAERTTLLLEIWII
jgi:hypothetical protein